MSERTTQRTCGQTDVTIRVLTDYGYARLRQGIEHLKEGRPEEGFRTLAVAEREVTEVAVAECPVIDTDVIVRFQRYGPHEGIERWTCPVCQFEHEDEVTGDDD